LKCPKVADAAAREVLVVAALRAALEAAAGTTISSAWLQKAGRQGPCRSVVQLSFPDTNSSLEQIIRKNEDTREAIRTSFSGVSSFITPLHDSLSTVSKNDLLVLFWV